jgi:hypothetical protein
MTNHDAVLVLALELDNIQVMVHEAKNAVQSFVGDCLVEPLETINIDVLCNLVRVYNNLVCREHDFGRAVSHLVKTHDVDLNDLLD